MAKVTSLRHAIFYELQNDLSNAAYDGNMEKFRTLYGKVKIKDIN